MWADVNGQDEGLKQEELLLWEKLKNKADTVQTLIRHGADVTSQDDINSTPLHLASLKGSAVAVRLLIQHGADVHSQTTNRSTPLHLAASSHLALEGTIVRLLLNHGADADAKDGEGRTPLEIAVLEGNSWIVKILLDHNARRG
jgi:ankyrin repeat protein